MKNILVIKNDRLGDFIISLPAFNLILNKYKNEKITFVLSDINYGFSFLLKKNNVDFIKTSYSLNFLERLNIFFFLLFNKIDKIYIFRPKNYFFFLSFVFRKIKFIGICVKNKGKLRPNKFFLKYLDYYLINDRDANRTRKSIVELQIEAIRFSTNNLENLVNNLDPTNLVNDNLPNNYILVHYKHAVFKQGKWTINNFISLLKKISIFKKIILITDLYNDDYKNFFCKSFTSIDLKKEIDNKIKDDNIIFIDNAASENLAFIIKNAELVVACHGTMTMLASYFNVKTLDLYYIDRNINNFKKQYLNSFREFRPFKKNIYKRIVFKEYYIYEKKIISFIKILLNNYE
jgi:ADP-heptose:LPS heptosyltransferase